MKAANELLSSEWFDELSTRFSVKPAKEGDVHRAAPSARELNRALSIWEERTVSRDAVVRWRNRWFQLKATKGIAKLAGREATVISRGEAVSAILVGRVEVRFEELSAAPKPEKAKKAGPKGAGAPPKPSKDHPWRKPFLDGSKRT